MPSRADYVHSSGTIAVPAQRLGYSTGAISTGQTRILRRHVNEEYV